MKKPNLINLKWETKKLPKPCNYPYKNYAVIVRDTRDGEEWMDIARLHTGQNLTYWHVLINREMNVLEDDPTFKIVAWAKMDCLKRRKTYETIKP